VQLYRFLRVASPVQRQQIKWLLYGFVPVIVLPLCLTLYMTLIPALNKPGAFLLNTPNSFLLIVTLPLYRFYYLPVPFCVGIALLRYRLWDIDLIINRTLVYGALSLSVIGVYVLVVVGLGTLIQVQGNVLLSLLATGVVAVLFQPLRLRLQRGVNRIMYGERDDPYAVLARLGSRLEATLVPEKVLPTIVETVAQALKLPYVAIALLLEQHPTTGTVAGTAGALTVAGTPEADIVASYGTPTAEPVRVPLVYQAKTVGHLLLAARAGDTFSQADERLLTDLARQAGVAVYAVGLTAHLKQLTGRLQQAREHLITTREEERRRLRRDLHDGLGPTLGHLTLQLDGVRDLIAQDPSAAIAQIVQLKANVQDAMNDIRRLVYELRPPALDELGLVTALREQAAQYHRAGGLTVTVEASPSLPALPAAVEVAAYRIALEALTNIVRHAQARTCRISLTVSDDLVLDIEDDGRGLPDSLKAGIGLLSMRERAAELGGICVIEARSEGGMRVRARLPLSKE
jgi:signal transduction histidine kinase